MTYYFAPIADGLGDLLVSLPALQALIDTGEPTYLILRSPKQEGVAELIKGLAGSIAEPAFLSNNLGPNDRLINLRNHPMQTNYIFGSDKFFEKFGRLNIVDVISLISTDLIKTELGIDSDFGKFKTFDFTPEPAATNKILLVPGSAGAFKCWTSQSWFALKEALNRRGLEVLMLGQPSKSAEVQELLDAGMEWLPTPNFAAAVDAISSARCIVSVDTGLMHLSVQQQKPTVAIFLERTIFFRREKNCFSLTTPDCNKSCLGWTERLETTNLHYPDYTEPTFTDCSAPSAERCMNQISVDAVLSQVEQALSCTPRI